jgi:pimeloyl-ACP methyl ester carboxylesterase
MKTSTKFILSLITVGVSGCSLPIKVSDHADLFSHMLALDRDGKKDCLVVADAGSTQAADINCSKDDNDQDDKIDSHIKRITNGLNATISKQGKVELLLFVHGGLVPKAEAAKQAGLILEKIKEDNLKRKKSAPYIYPIFVNWESGMDDAYFDHLYRIRQGRESKILGPISSPFYLMADFGRAFSRVPVTYGYQGYNAVKPTVVDDDKAVEVMNSQFYDGNSHDEHAIWLGHDKTSSFKKGLEKSTYLVPGVLKLLTTPMLDMIGKSSWENMLRRTRLLFRSPTDYKSRQKKTEPSTSERIDELLTIDSWNYPREQSYDYRSSKGGLSELMRALRPFREYQQNKKLSVTLIGHSMGAIVMSELLRRFSDNKEDLIYNDIVYMAAACTIRDFEDAVIPYLAKNEETNFYNLTLHPVAEENENSYWDTVPRGSLLVWIDDFASTPATRADLTLGRWNNAKIAWPFIPINVRKQITLKAFGIEDPSTNRGKGYKLPQKHGEFNDRDNYFWRREYWQIPKNQEN